MKFNLVIDYVGVDGVATSSKHVFNAIDLEHAVNIGRAIVEHVVRSSADSSNLGSFNLKAE